MTTYAYVPATRAAAEGAYKISFLVIPILQCFSVNAEFGGTSSRACVEKWVRPTGKSLQSVLRALTDIE